MDLQSSDKLMSSHSVQVSFHKIVWPIAFAEMIVWAAMFYVFPALLLQWEQDTGWSKAQLSGAFSLALLLSAMFAPIAGRFIDRGYGAYLFTGSAVFGACLLGLLSQVTELWQFYLIWMGLGLAMSGALYEATFAILTSTMGTLARRAIIMVTLIAGFAGTLSFPTTNFFAARIGWQGTVAIWGLIVLLLAVPLIWLGSRSATRHAIHTHPPVEVRSGKVYSTLRKGVFWLLAISFALIALDHNVLLTHLLPLLDEQDIAPDVAILAASMIGPMQVFGRIGMFSVESRIKPIHIFATCFVLMALAALALSSLSLTPLLLAIFVVFHGTGYGVTSIMRPVITADFLGRKDFGVVSGLLAIPFLLTAAGAPTIAALVWETGGYDLVILVAFLAAIVGLIALLQARRVSNKDRLN